MYTFAWNLCINTIEIESYWSLQDQYIFIHDAILEALTCGVTEVRARDLPNHFKWLLDTDSFTNNIRLVDEFDVSIEN